MRGCCAPRWSWAATRRSWVLDDADLDLAVREAMIAKMRLGGQSRVGATRFLVQEGIADAFATASSTPTAAPSQPSQLVGEAPGQMVIELPEQCTVVSDGWWSAPGVLSAWS
ncbi:aldehyde dehydrogenase family protein [Streptomyces caelestis]|uniref:aldehyde dehydrogenase family protein n=1 Tax=Streptomyces caelestis TaxID=36816 RepID=UPI0036FAC059